MNAVTGPQVRAGALERARQVQLVAFDVDGTLTDGRLFIGADGELMKAFSVRDGFGCTLLRRAGIKLAIVTGRHSAIVDQRARELSFDIVMQGVKDKRAAIAQLAAQTGIDAGRMAFVGDDWPDLPALRCVGLPACVTDAAAELREAALWVGSLPPGQGAVREFAEWLLQAQGRLDELRRAFTA
jgi:3-deoxy-D-manno-octulosonate 8-phosphate phosphatase (KDO 8-P phosphatase)